MLISSQSSYSKMIKIQGYIFLCLVGILKLTRKTQTHELMEILQILTDIKQVQSELPDKELISSMKKLFDNCVSKNNPEECNSQLRPDLLQRKLTLSRILSNDLGIVAKINEYEWEGTLQKRSKIFSRKQRSLFPVLGQVLGPLAGLVTEDQGQKLASKISTLKDEQRAMSNIMGIEQVKIKTDLSGFEAEMDRQSDQIRDVREKVTQISSAMQSLVMYQKLFEQVKNLSEGSRKLEEKLDKFIEASQSVITIVQNKTAKIGSFNTTLLKTK